MFRRDESPLYLRRPVRGGRLHQLHAKMNRLPAHLTSEDDWKQDQPGVRLSRVFGVVLGIHIVAIGGLMAYEMFRHRGGSAADAASMRPAPRESRAGSLGGASAARPKDTFADDPKYDGMVKHVVAPGERLAAIAARHGVDEKGLQVFNRIGEGRSLHSGMILVIPNRQLAAAAPLPPNQLLATTPAPVSQPEAPGEEPRTAAAAAAPSADGLVPVTPAPYNPKLETRRAEPIGETVAAKPAPSAVAKTAAAKPKAPATRPTAVAKVPAASGSTSTRPAAPPKKVETAATKPKPKPKGRVHVVRDGENAYRIAKAYGVNVDQLIRTNGINPNSLRPGTSLTIPPAR
jgi:LysM repeat protein